MLSRLTFHMLISLLEVGSLRSSSYDELRLLGTRLPRDARCENRAVSCSTESNELLDLGSMSVVRNWNAPTC